MSEILEHRLTIIKEYSVAKLEWICNKFNFGDSKELVKNFQDETHTLIDPVKQIKKEEREKEIEFDRW